MNPNFHFNRVKNKHGIAMMLAASLRDKFDFSSDSQFKEWAELSYKAAEAFSAVIDPQIEAANKKDFAEAEAVQNAAFAAADAKAKAQLAKDAETKDAVKQVIAESREGEAT